VGGCILRVEYRCRVATAAGHVTESTFVAESEARLRLDLEERGLHLLSIRPRAGLLAGRLRVSWPRRRGVPTADFLVFNQELATLLKAGLPLVQSLDILRKRMPNPTLRAALHDIHDRVRSGASLSEAFEAQHLFPGVYTASLMAGEKSGSLEQVLRRYVQHAKVLNTARAHVISALIYPAILVVLSAAVVGLIVFKVVPEFAAFYSQYANADLPLSTRVVVAISTSLVASGGLLTVVVLATAVALTLTFRHPAQRRRLHAAALGLPYFGPLARRFATAQVARTIATLLSGGIPLVNALDIAGSATGNLAISDHLGIVARQVREGRALASSLHERGVFPDVAVEMGEVGESTGSLADMLNSIADFYDEENETSLTRFSNAIQPILLIVMGAVIAGLLLSLYMPLFRLSSLTT